MDIKLYAAILLVLGIGSVVFISLVLRRQLGLFRLPIDRELRSFRFTLFFLAVSILLGNLVPLAIDVLTLLVDTGRPREVKLVSLVYTMSIHLTLIMSSYLIWRLYQLAADTKGMTEYTEKVLRDEIKKKQR